MGIVYKGVDPKIGRTVALKTLKAGVEMPEVQVAEFKKRFAQEAQSAGRLAHPNIVTIYDVGEEDGVAYIAMELLVGRPLDELIAERHAFSLDEIVKFMSQICDAMSYAHKNGVVHRDIKPANIIITKDGVAKITDFGIAKISNTSSTQTGMVVGTPSYMSPEQITGKGVDHRSDIFSLGAVFYELLTYEKAFPGDNITSVMYRVVHENPTPADIVNMTMPSQFAPILQKAMAKNPNDRYSDAEAFGRDIVNYKNTAAQAVTPTQYKIAEDGSVTFNSSDTGNSQGSNLMPAAGKSRKNIFLLGGLGLVIVLSWAIYVLAFDTNDKRLVTIQGNASLELSLNILDGSIRMDTSVHKIANGKVLVNNISATEHDLLIQHEGYQDFRSKLLFSENEEKKLDVQLAFAPVLFPEGVDTAYIVVEAKPDIIRVLTNTGKFIGYTPIPKLPFPVGKHTLVFAREDYLSQTMDIDLRKGKTLTLVPSLDFKKGKLSITDVQPKSVQLYLDEVLFKPQKDGTTYLLPLGRHKLILKQNGYRPYVEDVEITDKAIYALRATLEQIFGSASLSTDPPGADVYLDGNKVGLSPIQLDRIGAGTHEVKFQKGNLSALKKITISENRETHVNFKLEAAMGYVKLLVNPWAKIFVDGTEQGVTPPLDNLPLSPGSHQIRIENPAFKPVTKSVNVIAGGTTTLQHDFK